MTYELIHGDCVKVLHVKWRIIALMQLLATHRMALSFRLRNGIMMCLLLRCGNECLRVLKPGGHLLSFAGSRTYHRMAVNIEDAGFEIRDQIMWIYGSGFLSR